MVIAETATVSHPAALALAITILLLVYVVIAVEALHRTTATVLGVALLLFTHFVIGHWVEALTIWSGTGTEAFDAIVEAVDWNVVFLLFGMMILVSVLAHTGIFQVMALHTYRLSRGSLPRLALLLIALSAFLSAFLDNVTTILLLTPLTLEIALILDVDPIPLLLPEVFASNIGGAATLVGDPPNILVGSAAGLTFNEFLVTLGPVAIMGVAVLMAYSLFHYRGAYDREVEDHEEVLERLQDEYQVHHPRLLKAGLAVTALVVVLFLLHGFLDMEVSVAALIGAGILLPLARRMPDVDLSVVDVLHEVEWPTLVFFIMLFIIVGAVEATGALGLAADAIANVARNDRTIAIVLVVWISALMSALVDNIPFTATMIPVVDTLVTGFPGDATVLWWALVLGADFGGNATLVGASANIVAAGMAERAGVTISFTRFMRDGIPITLLTVTLATLYLLVVVP